MGQSVALKLQSLLDVLCLEHIVDAFGHFIGIIRISTWKMVMEDQGSETEQVTQKGNNRSPEEQLAQGINIIRNFKRPLMELLKLLELKPKLVSA